MFTAVGIREGDAIGFNFAVVLASAFLSGHQMEARRRSKEWAWQFCLISYHDSKIYVVVAAYAIIDSNIRSRSTKFITAKGKIFKPVVSLNFEHHAGDGTILLGPTPILGKNTLGGGQEPPTSLLPPTSREDLQLDGYLEYITVTTVTFSGHMAREASLHPISEKYIGTTVGCILLACRKQLIGRANRWSNFLGRADFCDHGGELKGSSLIGAWREMKSNLIGFSSLSKRKLRLRGRGKPGW
ncbi:hypothetical protein TNCV_3694501 [Trichonephila clavipes]|nr:hypothetical protein TNCV_3694501 [Trichonephila clavipes]